MESKNGNASMHLKKKKNTSIFYFALPLCLSFQIIFWKVFLGISELEHSFQDVPET